MFTNSKRQEERTGKYGTPRLQYLQELVTQFQSSTSEESKEKIVANLANFAYDPYNYTFLRQLNVLELFLDCITEPNEKLVEFGIGGICNSCVDPENGAIISQCGGIPLIIQCLSSPVRNTVNYALGALYYLCNESNKEEILGPEVVDVIKRYAAAGAVRVSLRSSAKIGSMVGSRVGKSRSIKEPQWPRPMVWAPLRATTSVASNFLVAREVRRKLALEFGPGMLARTSACVAKFSLSLLPRGTLYSGPPDCSCKK